MKTGVWLGAAIAAMAIQVMGVETESGWGTVEADVPAKPMYLISVDG